MLSYIKYIIHYIQNKYSDYILWTKILAGNKRHELSHLQLASRAVKASDNVPIVKDEDFITTSRDLCKCYMGNDSEDEVDKYCLYVPGIVYHQYPDGIHVKVNGDDHDCIMMSSLSYWGFHANKEVLEYAIQRTIDTGVGNHGSYLVTGRNTVVDEAYKKLANFFKRKYCAIAASGFLSCMNLIKFLVPNEGLIFIDERAHICLKFGSKLSGATTIKFPHNDFNELEKLIIKNRHNYNNKRCIIVLDGIYSAEGTVANIPEARRLCDKYKIELVVDEAHSLGSLGDSGHGIEEYYNMYGSCDYICGVFSKSLASYGGYVVSNNIDVLHLNVSPGIGFASGLQAFSAATVSKGLDIIERDGVAVRREMETLREYFVDKLSQYGIKNVVHVGHDIFLIFNNNSSAPAVTIEMRRQGYFLSAFMFPSVPLNTSTIRLTINPLITTDIIDGFCERLNYTFCLFNGKKTKYNKYILSYN